MTNSSKLGDGKFRILSLDGGGVRGILQARLLANIEALLHSRDGMDTSIGQKFDLIAGTSTGGIIALGLSIGRSAKEILAFYEKYIPKIFGAENKDGGVLKPLYKPDVLQKALVEFFGEKTLNDVCSDVCIPAVSLQNAKPRFYKSGYLERNKARLDEKLVDIALATSAAPVFFPAHSMDHSTNLVDGGICANNPSMISLIESMQFETKSKRGIPPPSPKSKRSLDDIVMLSIGTGEQCAMPYNHDKLKSGGALNWAFGRDPTGSMLSFKPVLPLVELLMNSQAQLVHFQTSFMLGENNYFRINPQLKFPMKLDDSDKIDELKNLSDITIDIEKFITKYF